MLRRIRLEDLTFIIPVKLDSNERFENLCMAASFLLKYFDVDIVIYESLGKTGESVKTWAKGIPQIKWQGIQEVDEVFHRTRILNQAIKATDNEFVAIWDSDVIVSPDQILAGYKTLRNNECDFILPYDGNFLDTGHSIRFTFQQTGDIELLYSRKAEMLAPYTANACGGGFLARRNDYQQVGLENEHFFGWGNEDGERLSRWRKLEKRVSRIYGPMFHLSHPRGINSWYRSPEHKKKHLDEFFRINKMSKSELENEIIGWEWVRKTDFKP